MNVKLLPWLFILICVIECKKVGKYPGIQSDSCGIRKIPNKVTTRIVNGTDAILGEFPWMVAIHTLKPFGDQNFVDHYCGGALITERFVVTAANCLDFPEFLPNHTWVIAGTTVMYRDQYFRDVLSVTIHERYDFKDPEGRLFNIALIEMSDKMSPLLSNESDPKSYVINSICLPEKGLVFKKERALFSGFGEIVEHPDPDVDPNYLLKKAEYTIEDCDQRQLCSHESEHMSCFRDSGSPLMVFDGEQAVLIGILTTVGNESSGCGKNWQYFTRVSYFVDWINENIGNITEVHNHEANEQIVGTHSSILFLIVIIIAFVLIGSGSLFMSVYVVKKKRESDDESPKNRQKSKKSKTSLKNIKT